MLQKLLFATILFLAVPAFAQFGQGWVPNPAETERFVRTIPAVYGDQVQNLVAADNNADALLYRALVPCLEAEGKTNRIKNRGQWKCVTAYDQGNVGSCVGHGTASALSVLNAVEVAYRKEPQEFRAMHSADGMYGLAREAANMLRNSDGCTGSGAARAVSEMGTLYAIQYGNCDLSVDQPARARQFGRSGVGPALKAEAAKRKTLSVYRARTAAEAWSLIGNGYPINVCSNQGFLKQRDKDGVCRPGGTWSHSMSVVGRRTTDNGRKLFLIWNSWGDDWASGPYREDMPFGSFWADYAVVDKMLRSGDSFAYSELDGFPARSIPDYGSKEYLGLLKIETESEVRHGQDIGSIAFDRGRDVDAGAGVFARSFESGIAPDGAGLFNAGKRGAGIRNESIHAGRRVFAP